MIATNPSFIFGYDLNDGNGFGSFEEAKLTLDFERIPYQSLWLINNKTYRLVKILGKPVFDFYTEEN